MYVRSYAYKYLFLSNASMLSRYFPLCAGIPFSFAFFGPGTGPILYDDFGCTGMEDRLTDCSHLGVGQHNCAHFEDAGVRCTGTLVAKIMVKTK